MSKGSQQEQSRVFQRFKERRLVLPPTSFFVDGVRVGNRTVLAQAITLVESTLLQHQERAQEVLQELLQHTNAHSHTLRVGITGVPGVGKSTFIESFGLHAIEKEGRAVAVLAIDPSSERTQGSILGDKTRMQELARHPKAFIRPSPTGGAWGGVARRTRETIILCEAAGFDLILVETVGVGQSETTVHQMVDFFLLLLLAGAGDELQGIKRGIVEMSDALVITKADGDNLKACHLAQSQYSHALHLFSAKESNWIPTVGLCSALKGMGISELWEILQRYQNQTRATGYFDHHRQQQAQHWLLASIKERLEAVFFQNTAVKERWESLEPLVLQGKRNPFEVANQLIDLFVQTSRISKRSSE